MNNERGMVRTIGAGALILALVAVSSGVAATENRFESWQQLSLSQNLDYNLTAVVETENRQAFQSPSWIHTEIDPQLMWRYSPRYDFTAGLEWSSTQYPEMSRSIGYQPFLETRIKAHSGRWDLSSRQRFQTGTDTGTYVAMFRQLTRLQYRLPGYSDRVSLYLDDEWFLNLLAGQINENRVSLGTSFTLNKAVNLELFGMLQTLSNAGGVSGNIPVLGIKAIFAF